MRRRRPIRAPAVRIGAGFGGAGTAGMGGRVVEGTGLENRQAGDRLVGSNPTPSATNLLKLQDYFQWRPRSRSFSIGDTRLAELGLCRAVHRSRPSHIYGIFAFYDAY